MAEEIMLNNYADDARIKEYISSVLAPRVFHDIPLNVLNTGQFSLINEYLSQGMEQLAFTSSFYFNESFITKAVLADSIYAEAAIFNIGYSYAIPSVCNFLLELKIDDIINNATYNSDNRTYEFILDKNTKFNLSNGSVYSLDYDILIQYKNEYTIRNTNAVQAWNVQYTNKDSLNSISKNKNTYIMYRVTDTWLCLFVTASEFERQTHIVVNNMANGIPNQDTVITCLNHIAGFDIKYNDGKGNEQFISRDHILPIHANVKDTDPYVHYIMDNPQTIRFMWQLNGNKYFVPKVNSSYEITIYTCHGEAANFSSFKNDEQPQVITASNRFSNNGNVMKAAFVISGSMGGTNIGTAETVRRETIEAYNTANDLSTDHDIEEWFKTFYFKNVLYPFFYKRRDDPWGRIWSGYIALKDDDDYVYKTNTLHGKISYDVLYSNNQNTITSNEIIIPPGWIWLYNGENKHTVAPYCSVGNTIEKANTLVDVDARFVFANPFGIRIQKDPFAIGYFNPWINEYVSSTHITKNAPSTTVDDNDEDISIIYHATPIVTNIVRTYRDNYYKLTTFISPTISEWSDGSPLVKYVEQNAVAPVFSYNMWNYFKEPLDLFASDIPLISLNADNGRIPFDPEKTYFCVKERKRDTREYHQDEWVLSNNFWIDDQTDPENEEIISLPITITSGAEYHYYGDDAIWGDTGVLEPIYVTGDTTITLYNNRPVDSTYNTHITFERVASQNYYEMRLDDTAIVGQITEIQVTSATPVDLTKYGEANLVLIGTSNTPNNYINIKFNGEDTFYVYTIRNAASIYIPWEGDIPYTEDGDGNRIYSFDFGNVGASGIILYADMKPTPSAGAIDYYRVRLSSLKKDQPVFHIANQFLQVNENNMRVILHASMNNTETGRIEMTPVSRESDGSIRFETEMYPLNQLIDVENRIKIASTQNGGGAWTASSDGAAVAINATNPELKMSILIRSDIKDRASEIKGDDEGVYTGYRLVDQYSLDNISLVQEMKEMRSVVDFQESSVPSESELELYNEMMDLNTYDPRSDTDVSSYGNLWNIRDYTKNRSHDIIPTTPDFETLQSLATDVVDKMDSLYNDYENPEIVSPSAHTSTDAFLYIKNQLIALSTCDEHNTVVSYYAANVQRGYYYNGKFYEDSAYTIEITPDPDMFYVNIGLNPNNQSSWVAYKYNISISKYERCNLICWSYIDEVLVTYNSVVNDLFKKANVNGGVEIQQIPLVEYTLMNSSRFENFVSSFTQVHKAIEPVIMDRLDGNHYLDCKLIATYGLPHTYCADVDVDKEGEEYFWPDLNVQIEFDVKLFNQALATNTLNELRLMVKSYFNRLTSIHTPVDQISMNNNIYVSHLIQQMEAHDNVAFMKFKGWYTNEKNKTNGNYMDANIQAIVQKWKRLDDFPKYWDEVKMRQISELEYFVPEMFILEDKNIVLNIIQ